MDKLIEMMAKVQYRCMMETLPDGAEPKELVLQDMRDILSVIRENYDLVPKGQVHLVAKVCPECDGEKIVWDSFCRRFKDCPTCKGHGVVPVKE